MASSRTLKQKLTKLLHSLGDYQAAIASSLDQRGVKGIPRQIDACPIANLVKNELCVGEVYADEDSVDIIKEDKIIASVKPSEELVSFMKSFDLGGYSYLAIEEDYADLEDNIDS